MTTPSTAPDLPLVYTEITGDIATIVINREGKRNAVDRATAELLRAAFEDFEHNDALKVAVLWGKGGSFCAG